MSAVKCMVFTSLYIPLLIAQNEPWTWHYHKIIPETEMTANKQKGEIIFTKVGIQPFTQLLFSWNAFRPKLGHYSFFVQVRDTKHKRWGPWHKMIDWGDQIQKSYVTKSDGTSHFVHVRLETAAKKKSDAFKIKIVSNWQADLSLIKSFTVNAADLSRFEPERMAYTLPSVHITGVPRLSQLTIPHTKRRMMCSPTSCSMLLGYLIKKHINPLQFAQRAFDYGLNAYGSWPFNTAHAFELSNGKVQFFTARLHSFKTLHRKLTEGVPVVVSVRGALSGAPKVYKNGHLLVVVGFDAQKRIVVCHDPACLSDEQTVKEYPVHSFIRAWERSRRLSYIANTVRLA